jgi:hypothetical protein
MSNPKTSSMKLRQRLSSVGLLVARRPCHRRAAVAGFTPADRPRCHAAYLFLRLTLLVPGTLRVPNLKIDEGPDVWRVYGGTGREPPTLSSAAPRRLRTHCPPVHLRA